MSCTHIHTYITEIHNVMHSLGLAEKSQRIANPKECMCISVIKYVCMYVCTCIIIQSCIYLVQSHKKTQQCQSCVLLHMATPPPSLSIPSLLPPPSSPPDHSYVALLHVATPLPSTSLYDTINLPATKVTP